MMALSDILSNALLKVADAMSESHTFPVNLLGPVLYEVGDWTIDKIDLLDSVIPFEVTTSKRYRARLQSAFELGVDAGRSEGQPQKPLPPVRRLHSV